MNIFPGTWSLWGPGIPEIRDIEVVKGGKWREDKVLPKPIRERLGDVVSSPATSRPYPMH